MALPAGGNWNWNWPLVSLGRPNPGTNVKSVHAVLALSLKSSNTRAELVKPERHAAAMTSLTASEATGRELWYFIKRGDGVLPGLNTAQWGVGKRFQLWSG